MERSSRQFRKASSLAMLALLIAALAIAGSLFAAPPDAAGQSSKNSPCRKEVVTAYHGGRGEPYFTGIPNAPSYEPATVVDGKRTVVRNLIDVYNGSETASCDWRVTSKSADWVSLDSESGSLSPDSHHTIRVRINDSAKSLRPGIYQARIQFQLGPESDRWNGYARVTLEILDKCHIKVRDTKRQNIPDGGQVALWYGTVNQQPEAALQHRVTVWNSSHSRCELSAESNTRWLVAAFAGATSIGKGETAALTLSANDHWNNLSPATYQAEITIRDAVSGATYQLYVVLETDNPPCKLVLDDPSRLQFEAVARDVENRRAQVRLENHGGKPCHWTAAWDRTKTWLNVTPDGDTLRSTGGDDFVNIEIVGADANSLKSSPDGQPYQDTVTFSADGDTEDISVPVSLSLTKPPCQLRVDTLEPMEIYYTPGETLNAERHHLTIRVSNAPDSQDCRYQANLPNWVEWLDNDAVASAIPGGESNEITVKLKAHSPEAQAGQQEYSDIITFAVAGSPDPEPVPISLTTDCPVAEPCAYLHTTHTEIPAGDRAEMTYAINNPSSQLITAHLTLELPSGWSMDGEGFADKCSGICTATHEVPARAQNYIAIRAYPNHPGQFQLKGRAEYIWLKEGQPTSGHSLHTIPIAVMSGIAPAPQPAATPTVVAPNPTVTPTPDASAVAALPPTPVHQAPTPVSPLVSPPENDPTGLTRNDIILAGGIGALAVVILAVVIGGTVWAVIWAVRRLLRPRRQRPAVPPTSQRRPPPGQSSARPATPNQRR